MSILSSPAPITAEDLRKAAAKLREASEQTSSQGPWRSHQMSVQAEDRPIAMAYQCYADAAWIALVHPGIAEPVAEWLESAADEYWTEDWTDCPSAARAAAVARVILGGAE